MRKATLKASTEFNQVLMILLQRKKVKSVPDAPGKAVVGRKGVDVFSAKRDAVVEILRFAQDDKRRHRRSVLGMTWRPEDTDRPG
jgi:hypothetical protein